MIRLLASLLFALTMVVGVIVGTRGQTPTVLAPAPSVTAPPTIAMPDIPVPPSSDLTALALQLRLKGTGSVPPAGYPEPGSESVGQQQSFWITNIDTSEFSQINATLRMLSPHVALYVQSGLDYPNDAMQRSLDDFENQVYPCVHQYFGSEWPAGKSGRLTILVGNIPGVAGYYSATDEYSPVVNKYSNQRKMFYLNAGAVRLGTGAFLNTMAHEFQHMVHFNEDPAEQAWVNEGLAELSAALCGRGPSYVNSYASNPNTQLTTWPAQPASTLANYGASYLFFQYLANRFGKDAIPDLVAEPKHGVDGVSAWLARHGGPSFDQVFQDWTVANVLNDPNGGIYSYGGMTFKLNPAKALAGPGQVDDRVRQFGERVYEVRLASGDGTLRFRGDSSVPMISADAAKVWWSNRADSMDSSLTRQVDLTGVTKATLSFRAWYELERDWDYAYVMASTDGGKTWDVLPARTTTTESSAGTNYGPGWTGLSGGGDAATWIAEQVDLTPYAGKRILLRFACITDLAVNQQGIALQNISIPEIGFADDLSSANGWTAQGFVLLNNQIPQPYQVTVIRFGKGGTTVETLPLDAENHGSATLRGFGSELDRALVVVSAVAPITTQDVPFRLTFESTP